jgi:hypothetical protein
MIRASHSLASRLHVLGFVRWAAEVHRWANQCSSVLSSGLCRWSCTIKTHKPDGKVTARSLHSSVGHCFNALGEVVNRLLSPALKSYPHICWSSEDVLRLVRAAKVGRRSVFMKFDVKEFFLSGDHSELARRSASLVDKPVSVWLESCLEWLLGFQFVDFDAAGGTHLQVTLGSGMGMRHSGSVSDASFLELVELQLLTANSRTQHGIELYARYRDDILVVLSDPQCCSPFVKQLVSLAAPLYVVERESFSLVGSQMLDLFVFKHLCGDGVHRLRCSPFVKPSARHIPLTPASCHAPSCHRAWPIAEVSRMHSRSFNYRHFRAFQDRWFLGFRRCS